MLELIAKSDGTANTLASFRCFVKPESKSSKICEPIPPDASGGPIADKLYDDLVVQLRSYMPPDMSFDIVDKAYRFAAHYHRDQKRRSGEPYVTHPLEVAIIATSLKLDLASILAAILHDTVEDTECRLEDIEETFGKPVRSLVDGLTKIAKIKFRSNQEKLAENFRKMVMAMANDLRVILVKLSDRLHNMRTLDGLPPAKRERIAQETLDIYAPLANRLGIYNIKSELEDHCLKQLKEDMYRDIAKKVSAKKTQREAYIDDVRTILEEELEKYGFQNLLVYGRPKHFFSIYKKMVERGLDFEDIHDLFAFRIVVNNVKDCYEALGVVHAMWKPMPGRFKDYIAMPKANLYQSLHTTVIRPNGEPIEIQIRTHEMHETCEYGVAAHWSYKEKEAAGNVRAEDLKKFSWLRQIMEWQSELKDPDEFLEAVKVDLFDEEIFVFTPKGDVMQLATGATALDFAFSVHSEVGVKTVGAKVNGRIVPIKKQLKSGDIVEILTSPHQKPGKDWLSFVTTSKARNKIRSYLRAEQRDRSRKLGRDLLQQALSDVGMDLDKIQKNGDVEQLIKTAKESQLDDVVIAIGYGKIPAKDLIERAFPNLKKEAADKAAKKALRAQTHSDRADKRRQKHGILVHGIENVMVNFGKCCLPLPGEEVVGFITRGRGVTVHRASCPRALDMDPHRRVEVNWANEPDGVQGQHDAFIRVTAKDKTGVLAEVTSAISSCGANIKKAQIKVDPNLMGVLDFEMTLQSMSQMQAIIKKIETIPSVVKAERMNHRRTQKT